MSDFESGPILPENNTSEDHATGINPRGDEQHPTSWQEYEVAMLCDDGKKRNEDGEVVDYPWHLTTP